MPAIKLDCTMSVCVSAMHWASREIGTHTSVAQTRAPGRRAIEA